MLSYLEQPDKCAAFGCQNTAAQDLPESARVLIEVPLCHAHVAQVIQMGEKASRLVEDDDFTPQAVRLEVRALLFPVPGQLRVL